MTTKKKSVAVTFGRANPPTAGHTKLLDKVREVADKHGADAEMHFSKSQDSKKNPLNHALKVKYLRKLNPQHKKDIKSDAHVTDPMSMMDHLHKKGYKEVHMVVGSDRVEGMKHLLNTYNGKKRKDGGHYKFDKIHVHSAGERDPDAEGTSGISASKMRAFAAAGDHKSFHKGLPAGTSKEDSKELMGHVRKRMGVNESVEQLDEAWIHGPKGSNMMRKKGSWVTFHNIEKRPANADPKKEYFWPTRKQAGEHEQRAAIKWHQGMINHHAKRAAAYNKMGPKAKTLVHQENGEIAKHAQAIMNHEKTIRSHKRWEEHMAELKATKGINESEQLTEMKMEQNRRGERVPAHEQDSRGDHHEAGNWHTWQGNYANKLMKRFKRKKDHVSASVWGAEEERHRKAAAHHYTKAFNLDESFTDAEFDALMTETFGDAVGAAINHIRLSISPARKAALHHFLKAKKEGKTDSEAYKHAYDHTGIRPAEVRDIHDHYKYRFGNTMATQHMTEELEPELEQLVEDVELATWADLTAMISEGELSQLNEVLSRMARIRAGARMHSRSGAMSRKREMVLGRMPGNDVVLARARRMAIRLMKQRLVRGRDPNTLPVSERERIEKIIAKRGAVIERIARRLVKKVRDVARQRIVSKHAVGDHDAHNPAAKGPVTIGEGYRAMGSMEEGNDGFPSPMQKSSAAHIDAAEWHENKAKTAKHSADREAHSTYAIKHRQAAKKMKSWGESEQLDEFLGVGKPAAKKPSTVTNKAPQHVSAKGPGKHLAPIDYKTGKEQNTSKRGTKAVFHVESEQQTDLTKISTEKLRGLHAIHKHMAGVRAGTAAGKAHAAAAARGAAELKKRGVLVERELTSAEKRKKEEVVMALKRKGETDKSKIYAIATHVAKKMNEERSSAHVAASVAMDQAIALAMHKAAKKDHNVSDDDCKYVHGELKAMNWLPSHQYFAKTKAAISQSVKQFVHEFNQVRPYSNGLPDDIESSIRYERRQGPAKHIIAKYTGHIAKLLDPALTEAVKKSAKKNNKKIKIDLSNKKTPVTVNPTMSRPTA